MRKIQKVAAPLLAGVLCLTAAACAAGAGPSGAGEASEAQVVPAVEPVPAAGQDPALEPVLEEAADYALAISDQPIPTVEGCLVSDRLPVRFINNTGEDGYVLDIPHLERKNEAGEWEPVPWREDVGFCGTPSPLPVEGRDWSEDLRCLWGALEDGEYRLSYEVGATFATEEWAYGEFTLYTPEDNQGMPLFSVEVFPAGEDSPGWTLSREDASELLRIYQGAKWTDVTADCLNDYRLVIAGETVYFHSDCGTFNDNKNNRSFTVPEEDRTAILAMLRAE